MKHRPWRSILVAIRDPFAAEQMAAAKAAVIARRSGAKLVLLNTFMIPQPVADVPMGDHRLVIASAAAQRKRKLEQLARKLRLRGQVRCEVRWDYPEHDAILRQVQQDQPDLVMMESHRHGHIARWLLRNSDWELIRACPCPVWFVRHAELRRRPLILASVDPMHRRAKPALLDSELLRVATLAAEHLNGSATVLHACELLEDDSRRSAKDSAEMTAAREATTTLAANHGVRPEECTITVGEPAAAISRVVRRDRPDVLVMGALSRGDIGRDVVGRTAERILDDVDCDVLVVKARPGKVPRVKARARIKAVSLAKRAPERRGLRAAVPAAGERTRLS